MNIEEAITKSPQMPEGSVLVARLPFTWGSEAEFVMLTDEYGVPSATMEAGFKYLLELDEIMDCLDYLKKKRAGTKTVAEFVIHYAVYDTAPAWIEDIPDA